MASAFGQFIVMTEKCVAAEPHRPHMYTKKAQDPYRCRSSASRHLA